MLALPVAGAAGSPPSAAQLRADDAAVAAKSRAAVLDLYSLDTQLTAAEQRLAVLQAAGVRLRTERANLGHELRLALTDERLSQDRLGSRLRFMYEHGSTSSLDIVMGASSLEDAMNQLDDFHRFTDANTAVLLEVRSAEQRLLRLRATLVARERQLAETTSAAARTVADLRQVASARSAYITDLGRQRSLDETRIAQITAEANAADAKSQALDSQPRTLAAPASSPEVPATAPPAAPAVQAGGGTMTVVATGYDLPGHTATGLPVGWGIAAVDPSVIPLGTRLVVPGYGVAVAADTGVYGASVDLWFPTAAQADAWGRRTVTISLG
jgi:cystine transport system substrate-binding protein